MTLSAPLRRLVESAAGAYARPWQSLNEKTARDLLHDPRTPATVLYLAARRIYGPEFVDFEPETMWVNTDPPVINRDKLLAAIAIDKYPSFFWDYRVFGNSALAFNASSINPDGVPHPEPEELAWAAFEGELIFALTNDEQYSPKFSLDVDTYVAHALHAAGFVVAPDLLDFADDDLAKIISADSADLRNQVSSAWRALSKSDLSNQKFEDTALGVQLARQAEVEVYLVNFAEHASECLAKL